MKKKHLALFIILAATALSGCAKPAKQVATGDVDTGVSALVKDWSQAGEEGRWDDLKALYADEPGFVWIEQGRVAYADHVAVVAGVDQAAAMGAKIESDVGAVSVTPLSPDAAAFHARTTLRVASPEFAFDFDGMLSGVAVKRGERWLFLQGHLSALQSPPDASASEPN